jgi:membrane-associated phospholipid phosphatase
VKAFAQFLSWILVPLLTPLFGLMIAMYIEPYDGFYTTNLENMYNIFPGVKLALIFRLALFTIVLPGIILFIMRMFGMISTIEMDDKDERYIPMFVMFICCIAVYLLMFIWTGGNRVPKFFYSYPLSGAIASLGYLALTKWWGKVSIHAGGAGIMTGFVFAYILICPGYQWWILPALFLASGLVMSARLYLHKHTLQQVIMGWCVGSFITFAVNYFY